MLKIGVVQPQNYQGHKPRPLRQRSPLEEELTAKGYTVVVSQWITPGYCLHCIIVAVPAKPTRSRPSFFPFMITIMTSNNENAPIWCLGVISSSSISQTF